MNGNDTQSPTIRHYFVDEAGDPTLFDRKGRIIVGTEGCSCYFILGLLHIEQPEALDYDLKQLHEQLLKDPYFKGVPSMQPEAGKTAVAFHAKDDLPEVRREVFSLMQKHDLRFFAEVRDKKKYAGFVQQWNTQGSYRYNPNKLYDELVSRLFMNRLHKADEHVIQFARRGTRDRTASLREALETSRTRFAKKWGIVSQAVLQVLPVSSRDSTGLQAADYLLWALQRFYERREDRYVELMWPAFRLIHDIDDTQKSNKGMYYSQKNPLIRKD